MRILLFLKVLLTFICDNVGGVACVHVEVIGQLKGAVLSFPNVRPTDIWTPKITSVTLSDRPLGFCFPLIVPCPWGG